MSVGGDTLADKARDFLGKGHLSGEQQGKGTQENCSAVRLTVLGFVVLWLVSRLSLANHSDPGSFLVVQASNTQPRRIPVRRVLGGRMTGISL